MNSMRLHTSFNSTWRTIEGCGKVVKMHGWKEWICLGRVGDRLGYKTGSSVRVAVGWQGLMLFVKDLLRSQRWLFCLSSASSL